ncbi:sucrase ferredoxin [Nocardia acididurans]|uniref:sucrase ferredoxin n=1 Tax=Nocardia acididurans TaxID=2802282 RepID=UPI0027DDA985|nr:sucrase ferredoxin [Nocardia acididurans]
MTGFDGMLCSAAAQEIPLPGSATHVTGWLCVEQPGAWGRDVIGDEVLGPEITAELAARTKAAHVRPTLIRRPGRNEFNGVRTVLLARTSAEDSWCERFEITDLKQLLDLDLHLLNGPAPGIGARVEDPLVLVCAHGKRDQCCALLGRPIAARLVTEFPDRVWECSHTGGHRFAPAVVLLPTGLTYGRVDADAVITAVEAAQYGRISLPGLRGRSCYTPVQQVAELAVAQRLIDETYTEREDPVAVRERSQRDEGAPGAVADAGIHATGRPGLRDSVRTADMCVGVSDLTVKSAEVDSATSRNPATFAGAAEVTHRDGRRWLVTAHTVAYAPRQASCGAAPKKATAVVADEVRLIL